MADIELKLTPIDRRRLVVLVVDHVSRSRWPLILGQVTIG